MNKFHDHKTLLTWEQYDPKNPENYTTQNAILDRWSPKVATMKAINPNHYIMNLYTDFYGDTSNLFYCYQYSERQQKEVLVGIAIITPPLHKGNNATLDYLVAHPQNKGIGTRMVKSITHNLDKFVGNTHTGSIEAVVRESNLPEQMIFIKNKYQVSPKIHPNNTPESIDRYLKCVADTSTITIDEM